MMYLSPWLGSVTKEVGVEESPKVRQGTHL